MGASDVARMRQLIPTVSRDTERAVPNEPSNPPAIFILAPHRSGTTLLRIMLAGHHGLFAAPELQLLNFSTLQQRRAALTGKYSLWLEGTIRTLMEAEGCGPDEAKRIMDRYEADGLTTKQFYRVLQDRVAPRTLVDKSPVYALDPEALARAEAYFDGALYIHLVRHPYAMIRSFESFHMDHVLLTDAHPYSSRQLAELVWTISHQNILELLARVPQSRQCRMTFEALTTEPRKTMAQMCEELDLEFDPELLRPYHATERKMTEGLYPDSTPMGDAKFRQYGRIDSSVADAWQRAMVDDSLGSITWDLADSFGYQRPTQARTTSPASGPLKHEARLGRRGSLGRQRQRRHEHRSEHDGN